MYVTVGIRGMCMYSGIYELQSKLLVSPSVTIIVPKIIPHITIFKEFRLWLIWGEV